MFLLFPLGIVLTVLIGIVSGAELPIFSKLIEIEKWHVSQPIIGVLTSDYFGAFTGIITFTFFLNPFFGLIPSILISQLVTLGVINATFFYFGFRRRVSRTAVFLVLINIYVAGMLLWHRPIVDLIDAISGF
jgi:spermidine synthase